MNTLRQSELIPEKQKPDFISSFKEGFFIVMKSAGDTNFRAITSDSEYTFEFNSIVPNDIKAITGIENSSDIDETIAGYQEKTTLQFMGAGDYPLPDPIPKEYRKLVTTETVSAYLSELSVQEKTQEYKNRMNAIFDTWNAE